MRKNVKDFFRRGFIACGLGPVVLAVLYMILYSNGVVDTVSVPELCTGIFSLTALAFVAGGTNVVYRIERLPLAAAVLIHGVVLYASYLAVYLINGWLKWGRGPILVFTGIFAGGYFVIWLVIYTVTRRKTARLNEMLKETRQNTQKQP